jgi:hypothetical protein
LVGSCCIGGNCYDRVSRSLCNTLSGSWDTSNCDGRVCLFNYSLNTETPTTTSTILNYDNTATPTNKSQIAIFTAKTDDTNAIIDFNNSITDPPTSLVMRNFYIRDVSGTLDTNGRYVITAPTPTEGITFAVLWDNTSDNIDAEYTYGTAPLTFTLKDRSGVAKTSLQYNTQPQFISTCAGAGNSRQIKINYIASRYCRDCYLTISGIAENIYYEVQQQQGSFDFCVDLNKTEYGYNLTPLCTVTSPVTDVNNCKITDINNTTYNPILAKTCNHKEYGFLTTNCDGGCTGIPIQTYYGFEKGCKGVSLNNQYKYPYWSTVNIENPTKLSKDLYNAGITLTTDINDISKNIINYIKSSTNPDNALPVLFNQQNQNKGITFIANTSLASCCPATSDTANDILLNFTDATHDVKYFVMYVLNQYSEYCTGSGGDPGPDGGPGVARICSSSIERKVKYGIIVKAYFKPGTDEIDTSRQNCLIDIINVANISTGCANSSGVGGQGGPNCTFEACRISNDNNFNIVGISEIKSTDTLAIPGSNQRKLIINRTLETKIQNPCPWQDLYWLTKPKDTPLWFTSNAQYINIGYQIRQIFWYPLMCQNCSQSGLIKCDHNDCYTVCMGQNGSPYRSLAQDDASGSNIECINNQFSSYRKIILTETMTGTDTIITPRIYNGLGVEQSGEYFYWLLGHPDSVTQTVLNPCNYINIQKAVSGTAIKISNTDVSGDGGGVINNEFVVYYTNGRNEPFYSWQYYTDPQNPCKSSSARSAPITVVEKYKPTTSTLPSINFDAEINRITSSLFTIDIKTKCASQNNISSCIPVGDFGNITGTSWIVDSWMINAWYEYDGIVYNFSSDYIFWYNDAQVRLQPLSEYAFDASKWTNSTGYNGPLTGNFYVTLMAVLVDGYGTGYTRVVEKTKVFSVQKNITLTGSTTRRENKYKLVADDTGATQCVLMDCSVTSDCSGLPDC